ncbi:MAG: DNA-processing protein DprA [Oscillospiraceae bacterium]
MERRTMLWIWLYSVLGPCSAKFTALLNEYGSIEEIYESRRTAFMLSQLSPAEYRRAGSMSLEDAEIIFEKCEEARAAVICYSDEAYPKSLRKMRVPPICLFVTGHQEVLNGGLMLAGVGTRNSTKYGRECVEKICRPLAQNNITLVSGMAHGIDAEVHAAALKEGAPTIAVLGTAIDETYPAAHRELRRQIEAVGAAVSEYAPSTGGFKGMFPMRNRIISGLSSGVIIFEASKKSGTMITANWALDDGREVFAVPGDITRDGSEGTNYLIKLGAVPVTCAGDVLEYFEIDSARQGEQMMLEDVEKKELIGIKKEIYNALFAADSSVEQLMDLLGAKPHELFAALGEMEIDGLISALPGSRFKIK